MCWQLRLIGDYISIDKLLQSYGSKEKHRTKVCWISDSEVLTIYFWGLNRGFTSVKKIHEYTCDHLKDWFPKLPKYERFIKRLNALVDAIELLGSILFNRNSYDQSVCVIDSQPIVIAKQNRASKASVASDIADKGYCSSKKEFYYGVKLHLIVGGKNKAPYSIMLSDISRASEHDINFLKRNYLIINSEKILADKAYISSEISSKIKRHGANLVTPIKKPKGGSLNFAQHLFSVFVSSARQTIETAFAWLNAKFGLANASKVRSTKGLRRHVFGILLAASL